MTTTQCTLPLTYKRAPKPSSWHALIRIKWEQVYENYLKSLKTSFMSRVIIFLIMKIIHNDKCIKGNSCFLGKRHCTWQKESSWALSKLYSDSESSGTFQEMLNSCSLGQNRNLNPWGESTVPPADLSMRSHLLFWLCPPYIHCCASFTPVHVFPLLSHCFYFKSSSH